MPDLDHEWLEVGNRRWCLCCGAYQSRRDAAREWTPTIAITHCPHDTPYGMGNLKQADA